MGKDLGLLSNIPALLKTFAVADVDLSRRYCGNGALEGSKGAENLTSRPSKAFICFRS